MNNILITGERWSRCAGELLEEVREIIQCPVGGYWVDISRDKLSNQIRVFDLTSLYEEDSGNIFFRKDDSTGFSKLNIEIFNTKGVEILQKSFENREVLILNEIGFLESKAAKFTEEVIKLLDSPKVVIALVKGVTCPYIDSILQRKDIELFEVNYEDKEITKSRIVELLKSWKVSMRDVNENEGCF